MRKGEVCSYRRPNSRSHSPCVLEGWYHYRFSSLLGYYPFLLDQRPLIIILTGRVFCYSPHFTVCREPMGHATAACGEMIWGLKTIAGAAMVAVARRITVKRVLKNMIRRVKIINGREFKASSKKRKLLRQAIEKKRKKNSSLGLQFPLPTRRGQTLY